MAELIEFVFLACAGITVIGLLAAVAEWYESRTR